MADLLVSHLVGMSADAAPLNGETNSSTTTPPTEPDPTAADSSTSTDADEASPSTTTNVVTLPLHALPAARARRSPGRPRKIRRAPDADEDVYRSTVQLALEAHVAGDAVVQASDLRGKSLDLAWAVLREVAREAAAIAYEIQRHPDSREAERARSRRVDALMRVAQLRVEIEKADDGFAPHVVARVVRLLVDGIGEVALDCLGPEGAALLMSTFEDRAVSIAAGGHRLTHLTNR